MTVQLTFSTSNGGSTIEDDQDHGSAGNAQATTAQTIYIRHDGDNPITECSFFLSSIGERYEGDFTADGDIDEVIGWGDETEAEDFGGFFFNLNAIGSFPAASWPTLASKSVASGSDIVGVVCRTGAGDSSSSGVSLVTQMGCVAAGQIQSGSSPNVRFQCKISIPQNEDTNGERHIKQVLMYDYTS